MLDYQSLAAFSFTNEINIIHTTIRRLRLEFALPKNTNLFKGIAQKRFLFSKRETIISF
jgi:hypothetical protein